MKITVHYEDTEQENRQVLRAHPRVQFAGIKATWNTIAFYWLSDASLEPSKTEHELLLAQKIKTANFLRSNQLKIHGVPLELTPKL